MVHLRTAVASQLDEQMGDIVDAYSFGIDGFQVNWLGAPSVQELADFRRSFDNRRAGSGLGPSILVLQLLVWSTPQRGLLVLHRQSPLKHQHPDILDYSADVIRYVEPYVRGEAITHVLYDPAVGRGLPLIPMWH